MIEGLSEADEVAAALKLSIGLFLRRLRQSPATDELTISEQSLLSRLERGGPSTASDIARAEQVTPQAIGPTVVDLEGRGLIARRSDPADGRRILLSLTEAGLAALRDKRTARVEQIARALTEGFSPAELATLRSAAPLIERLGARL